MRSQAAVPVALAWCSETAFCLALGRAGGPETCSETAGVLHSQDASQPPTCQCTFFSQPWQMLVRWFKLSHATLEEFVSTATQPAAAFACLHGTHTLPRQAC